MAVETFKWIPLADPIGTISHRTLSAQFGEGYKQVAPDGINTKVSSWPLSFAGRVGEILPILQFLDKHGEWKSFYWTPPLGNRGVYRASTYTLQAGVAGTHNVVSVTFTEDYRP